MYLNLFIKFFITFLLIFFSLISLSLSNFISIWFIMEISNFFFIILLSFSTNNKKIIFLYFIIQICASSILIFNFILLFSLSYNSITYNLIFLSMILKLSIPPLHAWMPHLSIFLPWTELFFLLTTQKITPFYLFSLFSFNLPIAFIYSIIILSSLIPPIKMFNLTNFKKLISYSSINQYSWLIMLNFIDLSMWLIYFFFYSILLKMIIFLIKNFKIFLNLSYFNSNMNIKMTFLFLFLNIAGMPPVSFFLMKWFSIYLFLFSSTLFSIFILMIISSFFMMYIYISMCLSSMFTQLPQSKILINMNFIYKNYFFLLIYMTLFSSLFLIIN